MSIDTGADTLVPEGAEGWAPRFRQLGTTVTAVGLALVVGCLVFLLAGANPLEAYGAMLRGAFGSRFAVSQVLVQLVPLLIISLGLALAFRGRIWNIGAEGQFLIGALTGAAFAILVPIGTPALMLPLAMVVGAIAGAAWGGVVGVMRTRWKVNEIIASLLLNYVAYYLYQYVIRMPLRDPEGFLPQSALIPPAATMSSIPGFRVHWGLFLALGLVPLMAYVVRRTPFGFRVGMMGLNLDAARTAGVNTAKMTVRLMLISGAMAGLAGIVQILGVQGRLTTTISAGFGFTAIVVALLGRLSPWGVLLAAGFMAALVTGGRAVQLTLSIPFAAVATIEALFVVFLLVADKMARR